MLGPAEIKEKALKKYFKFLLADFNGDEFFPIEIPFGKVKAADTLKMFDKIRKEIGLLKESSKEEKGYGYGVEYIERVDRKIGRQLFPQRVYFDSLRDYLKFISKEDDYQKFKITTDLIIENFPKLKEWIGENIKKISSNYEIWKDILKVVDFFIKNPVPDIYIREVPVEVDTKFIENNKSLIKSLLDFLIPDFINHNETVFEKRFNLKFNEPLIRIKILDKNLSEKSFSGLSDISIPQSEFNELNISCEKIIILENKTNFSNIYNFLTLPVFKDTIAIFGRGYAVGLLKSADWLRDREIIYWGDIDVHGFNILSNFRKEFKQVKSIMMDMETFKEYKQFTVDDSQKEKYLLDNLTDEENELYQHILNLKSGNRLEQEKIDHTYVVKKIEQII